MSEYTPSKLIAERFITHHIQLIELVRENNALKEKLMKIKRKFNDLAEFDQHEKEQIEINGQIANNDTEIKLLKNLLSTDEKEIIRRLSTADFFNGDLSKQALFKFLMNPIFKNHSIYFTQSSPARGGSKNEFTVTIKRDSSIAGTDTNIRLVVYNIDTNEELKKYDQL